MTGEHLGTLPGRFFERARERANDPLWYRRVDRRWQPITWDDARERVVSLAAGLIALGVEPGSRVGLLGPNRPEWVIADYAIQTVGAATVPTYVTAPPWEMAEVMTRSQVAVCIVDGKENLERIGEANIPNLERVVAVHLDDFDDGRVVGVQALEAASSGQHRGHVDQRLASLSPQDVATVVFTSGTTGRPKGVVLTHDNLVWTGERAAQALGVRQREVLVSFLPLSHALERLTTAIVPLVTPSARWTCWFVDDMSELPDAVRSVRPTIFLAVPLLWVRVRASVIAELERAGPLTRLLARRLLEPASHLRPLPIGLEGVGPRIVGRKVLARLGLDRCWFAGSGAAAISAEVQRFFLALGLPVHQGWGLTETTALCSVQRADDVEPGVVGAPLPGVEVRLAWDGEILVRGPNVFAGYLDDPELTDEMLDDDGFLHTGDLGRVVNGDRIRLIDRKADLIATLGGRKVAPRPIEVRLTADSLIGGAMVLGEGRPYLVALLTLDAEEAARIAADQPEGSEVPLWDHPVVLSRLERMVTAVNRDLAAAEQVRKWALLPLGFPEAALTPSLKLRRQVVERLLHDRIEELYA